MRGSSRRAGLGDHAADDRLEDQDHGAEHGQEQRRDQQVADRPTDDPVDVVEVVAGDRDRHREHREPKAADGDRPASHRESTAHRRRPARPSIATLRAAATRTQRICVRRTGSEPSKAERQIDDGPEPGGRRRRIATAPRTVRRSSNARVHPTCRRIGSRRLATVTATTPPTRASSTRPPSRLRATSVGEPGDQQDHPEDQSGQREKAREGIEEFVDRLQRAEQHEPDPGTRLPPLEGAGDGRAQREQEADHDGQATDAVAGATPEHHDAHECEHQRPIDRDDRLGRVAERAAQAPGQREQRRDHRKHGQTAQADLTPARSRPDLDGT